MNDKRIIKFFLCGLMIFKILTVGLSIAVYEGICFYTFVLCDFSQVLCPNVHKINALKRSSDIVLLKFVLIKRRPELALSTNALVADIVNKMLSTFFVLGNIASRLLFDIYFSTLDKLLNPFCCDAQHFTHKVIS